MGRQREEHRELTSILFCQGGPREIYDGAVAFSLTLAPIVLSPKAGMGVSLSASHFDSSALSNVTDAYALSPERGEGATKRWMRGSPGRTRPASEKVLDNNILME